MQNYIWNLFATIKNGQLAKRKIIEYRKVKVCESFLKILWKEGLISGYSTDSNDSTKINVSLKYYRNGYPVINSLKTISTPGRQIHLTKNEVWKLDTTRSIIILSTDKGLKSATECKRLKLGGIPFIIII